MKLKFIQSADEQKVSDLEKNLQTITERLKIANVTFGTKILNDSSKTENTQNVENELLQSWIANMEERKVHTKVVLEIENTIERKRQLSNLQKETEQIIKNKEKNIFELKGDFALSAYKNHREYFEEILAKLPEISQIEDEIETEQTKINLRMAESEKANLFGKFMPSVKNIFSKGTVNLKLNKLDKTIRKNYNNLFSEEDFENLYKMPEELPEDLQKIIFKLKENTKAKKSAKEKLEELQGNFNENDKVLLDLEAKTNSKKRIYELMKKIEVLDTKIEKAALTASNNIVDTFFDENGASISETELPADKAENINEIAKIRRELFEAKIKVELAKKENEIITIQKKLDLNLKKIARAETQIENLNDKISLAQNDNVSFQESIESLNAEIKTLQEKL